MTRPIKTEERKTKNAHNKLSMSKTLTDDNPTDKLLVSAFVSFTKLWKLRRFDSFIAFSPKRQRQHLTLTQKSEKKNNNENGQYKLWFLSYCLWFASLLGFTFVTTMLPSVSVCNHQVNRCARIHSRCLWIWIFLCITFVFFSFVSRFFALCAPINNCGHRRWHYYYYILFWRCVLLETDDGQRVREISSVKCDWINHFCFFFFFNIWMKFCWRWYVIG